MNYVGGTVITFGRHVHTPLPKTSLGDADEFGRTANAVRIVGVSYLLSTRARSARHVQARYRCGSAGDELVIVSFYAGLGG